MPVAHEDKKNCHHHDKNTTARETITIVVDELT
jgi:hypothetical protein